MWNEAKTRGVQAPGSCTRGCGIYCTNSAGKKALSIDFFPSRRAVSRRRGEYTCSKHVSRVEKTLVPSYQVTHGCHTTSDTLSQREVRQRRNERTFDLAARRISTDWRRAGAGRAANCGLVQNEISLNVFPSAVSAASSSRLIALFTIISCQPDIVTRGFCHSHINWDGFSSGLHLSFLYVRGNVFPPFYVGRKQFSLFLFVSTYITLVLFI